MKNSDTGILIPLKNTSKYKGIVGLEIPNAGTATLPAGAWSGRKSGAWCMSGFFWQLKILSETPEISK